MSLLRSVATVGSFTLLSRVTGLMREMMIANFLGAGAVADAFFVAFRFPNLFRSLFAEGAFNAAFVPLLTGKLSVEGRAAAQLFAQQAFSVMALVVAVFVIVMELAMPLAIYGLAPGFAEVPGKIELATTLSQICFPYLFFITLVSLQAGVLNAMGRFAAAAATPILLNVVMMSGLWALSAHTPTNGHALAWSTFAAGVVQFLWLAWAVRRADFPLRLVRPRLSPAVITLIKRIVPGAIGAGVYQVNLLITTIIASLVADGAVSYLNYADRVSQLPLGVVGVAIGTALLPLLSRQIKTGDLDGAHDSQNRAMEFALLLTLPAACALIALSEPIIRVLFQRGAFTAVETAATAKALSAFALGLPAFVMVKAVVTAFFAREDTKTPVKVAFITMLVNVTVSLSLVWQWSYVGMAIASSIAAWFNFSVLLFLLARRGHFRWDTRFRQRMGRIVLSAIAMTAVLWVGCDALWGLATDSKRAVLILGLLVLGGGLVYAVAAHVSGAATLGDLKAMMRKKPGPVTAETSPAD